jgi:hypothetical protein
MKESNEGNDCDYDNAYDYDYYDENFVDKA